MKVGFEDEEFLRLCAADSRPLVISDLRDLPNELRYAAKRSGIGVRAEQRTRSALYLPLDLGATVAGVLAAYGCVENVFRFQTARS